MSSISLTSQVWGGASGNTYKVNGQWAANSQSWRTLNPNLNIVSHVARPANDPMSGRAAYQNTMNGVGGDVLSGFAGLDSSGWNNLTTNLRQVQWLSDGTSSYYDTLEGTNRSAQPSFKAGSSGAMIGVHNGPMAYENTPMQSNMHGQLTSVDRQRYMAALYGAMREQEYGSQNQYY